MEKEVYEKFVKGSVVITLALGGLLGALLLAALSIPLPISFSPSLMQLHAHFQLFGWLGLFVMGIAYHVVPRFKAAPLYSKPLANYSFWLVLAGVIIRGLTAAFPGDASYSLLILSGALQSLGIGLFTYVLYKTVLGSEQKHELFEGYLGAGVLWFLGGSLLSLATSVLMMRNKLEAAPQVLNEALIHVMLYGFAAMMIMGVGIRTLPVFLGLKEVRKNLAGYVLIALNTGIILRITALLLGLPPLLQFSAILEAASIAVFIYALNLYAKPEIELPPMEASTHYERAVKGAYLWLVFAVALDLYLTLSRPFETDIFARGAYIHAFTVGFISMMIFGYATRIIPIFRGVDLHSLRLADAALLLLVAGNALRVALELLRPYTGALMPLLGLSGMITLAAYAAFGYNIWLTINKPYEE